MRVVEMLSNQLRVDQAILTGGIVLLMSQLKLPFISSLLMKQLLLMHTWKILSNLPSLSNFVIHLRRKLLCGKKC